MSTILSNAVIYLLAISLLVAVHEFGHFWVARRIGVKVLRFSIGFGRVLWSRPLKDGAEFAISAIPLGGYVSMLGERDDTVPASEAHRAFKNQPPHKRIAVMAAGPIANFLFAILAYWLLFLVSSPGLKPVIGDVKPDSIAARAGLQSDDIVLAVGGSDTATRQSVQLALLEDLIGDRSADLLVTQPNGSPRRVRLEVGDTQALTQDAAILSKLGFDFWYPPVPAAIGKIRPGSAAEQAQLQVGDRIISVNGESVPDFNALAKFIGERPDSDVTLVIERKGNRATVHMRTASDVQNGRKVGRLGVEPMYPELPQEMMLPRDSVFGALGRAASETATMTAFVFKSVWYLIAGKVSLQSVSGPVGIATVAGEAARIGVLPFIGLLALVSISLGALNLLPIPVLDGGQIVFQVAEVLKGRPVSERTQAIAQQVGIALLILLTVLAFYNDIVRLS